jgi:hypothetical protein
MTETNNGRMVLLLIAGIPLTMILAATWLWFYVAKGDLDLVGALGTANRGILVSPPRQFDEVPMFSEGAPSKYAELEPKWTLVVPWSGGSCNATCENTLYTTRQIHVAIGKNFNRIRRFYVSDTPVTDTSLTAPQPSADRPLAQNFLQYLETAHRGLKIFQLEEESFPLLFQEWQDDPSTWYLIDPRGWIMMSYNKDTPYKDVIADLKFLLKNSSD